MPRPKRSKRRRSPNRLTAGFRRLVSKALARPVDGKTGFDIQPVKLAGFTLSARAATPVGRPTLEQWTHAFWFACATEEAADYWIGDLLALAESRADWQEKLDQAMTVSGLARHTLDNKLYVSRHVAEAERQIAPTPAHAAEVAKLPVRSQRALLTKAKEEGWTVRELRKELRATQRDAPVDTTKKAPDALEQFLADRHITTLWPRDVDALRKFIAQQTAPLVSLDLVERGVALIEQCNVRRQSADVIRTVLVDDLEAFVRDVLAVVG